MRNRSSRRNNDHSRRFISRHLTLLSVLLVLAGVTALSTVFSDARSEKKGDSATSAVKNKLSAKPAEQPTGPLAAAVTVSLPNICAAAGSDITIPITVDSLTGQGIQAYDLQVTFDSTKILPQGTP